MNRCPRSRNCADIGHLVDACSVQRGRCRERAIHEVAVEHGQAVTADPDPQPHALLGRPSGTIAGAGLLRRVPAVWVVDEWIRLGEGR
jgi:hypothetical protein